MEFSFNHSFPLFFVALALLISAGLSYLVYFRNKENSVLSPVQKSILAGLRWISLFLVILFLLSPVIQRTKRIRQLPILAVAIDNSMSAKPFGDSYNQLINAVKDRFQDNYQLNFWTFGENTTPDGVLTGDERRSDYGQLVSSVKSNYINKNIGALIVVGDGIYNQGQNPLNFAPGLQFPVYTLGVGDTTLKADAMISNVKTNKIAYLNNKFPVEIELKFSKLKDKIAQIEIENNNQLVYSSTLPVVSNDDFKLEFASPEASKTGLQHYKIRLKPFAEEVNRKNNEYEFVIQVLENKQRILVLSDGPHPDLGALRSGLSELQNYESEIITGDYSPDSLKKFSLIILNQLPSKKNTASGLMSRIKESRIPVLFLIGPNSLIEQVNSLDMGLKIASSPNTEEVQATFDEDFSLFVLSGETKDILASAPPLLSPFGTTEASPALQKLAWQSIKNIPTPKTLMVLGSDKGRKVGFIVGEGIWRWRLFNYQYAASHEAFNELIQKMVQYLSLRENEDNFNVNYPALFQETDQIEFTAELYNDSYELVNTPDVNISIQSDSLKEFNYTFDRTSNFYRLNAGNLPPGDYSFMAETQLGNQRSTENGSFSIVKNEVELQNNRADFGLLFQLAQQTGGKFSAIDNYGIVLDAIADNKQITVQQHQQTLLTEWINLKWLFFLLIVLMSAEWFFRKFWGIY